MYEIRKKQSLLVKIGIGIFVLLLTTALLKTLFKEPLLNVSEELREISNYTNKQTPIQIDSLTELVNTQALVGNKLRYNILIKNNKENIDTAALLNGSKLRIKNMLKTDPKAGYFRENNIVLVYRFIDIDGNYVCEIEVPTKE